MYWLLGRSLLAIEDATRRRLHTSPLLVGLPDPGSRIRGASVRWVAIGYARNLESMAEVTDVAELPDGMTLPEPLDALDGAFAGARKP